MNRNDASERIGILVIMGSAMLIAVGCTSATSVVRPADANGQSTVEASVTPDAHETSQANDNHDEANATPGAEETGEANDQNDDGQDKNEHKVTGQIQSINGTIVVVDGKSYQVPPELADKLANLAAGDTVKIHFFIDASSNLVITEIEIETAESTETPEMEGTEESDDQGENEDHDSQDDSGDGAYVITSLWA